MTDTNQEPVAPVTCDPEVMGGEPCIAGTRIPVRAIQSFAPQGVERIKSEYPTLTDRQIADALAYPTPSDDVAELVEELEAEFIGYNDGGVPVAGDVVEELIRDIKGRILGVHPDDQDITLQDCDWEIILTALTAAHSRDDVIEECARVAEHNATGPKLNGRDYKQAFRISKAIRALKSGEGEAP